MSAIDDLIAQVQEPRLREQLKREWAEAQKTKKFGLVFDRHLPELVPTPKARPRRGDLVARKGGSLTDLWRVRRVSGGVAHCVRPEGTPGAGDPWDLELDGLVVVRRFGEPIFPALVPMDQVQNGPADAPWHCLIEADNFHALQLLGYLYAGKVDCIYIDPPYNTGARDWKYNNDYVDGNDSWRHSKWLSFMEKRLRLAQRLLRPDTGVLIVTIDEHEMLYLGVLLRELLPSFKQQVVTVVTNEKGVEQGTFARSEEYAIYCFPQGYRLPPHKDDLLSRALEDYRSDWSAKTRWERLQRGGNNADPDSRPGLFYPIYVDVVRKAISEVGTPLSAGGRPDKRQIHPGVAWPIRRDGSYATWQVGPARLKELISLGYVKLGSYDKNRQTWTFLYLGKKARDQIDSGILKIVDTDADRGFVKIEFSEAQDRTPKTVWNGSLTSYSVFLA